MAGEGDDRCEWRLSDHLRALIDTMDQSPEKTISIAEVEVRLKSQATALMLIVLAIPFIQPIPLPGVSIVLGLLCVLRGINIARAHQGSLPGFISRRELPEEKLKRMIEKVLPLLTRFERLFRRRWTGVLEPPGHVSLGLFVVLSGLALMLPLPPVIIFSNSLPAWSVICIGVGILQKDGLMAWLGKLIGVATWVYFYLWWEVVEAGLRKAWESWVS